jgi:hypothetical protein
VDSLEQRQLAILCVGEDPLVEIEPGELPIQVGPRLRIADRLDG